MTDFTDPQAVWNQRFSTPDYLFGEEPNAFLASQAQRLGHGRALALFPSAAIKVGTVAAGVQITARSGTPGKESTSGQTSCPSMRGLLGFTNQIGPLKPAPWRLRMITLPRLSGWSDAPIKAMETG